MFSHLAGISVLVTGGSGFIGSHLVNSLQAAGARVTNLDIRAPQLREHQQFWRSCDLLDQPAVAGEVAKALPSVAFNLAARTDISSGHAALKVNTVGLATLAAELQRLDHPTHLIHASTQLVMRPGHVAQHELDFAPYSAYGESKADSEKLLHDLGNHPSWTIVRPTNVWGPRHPTFANQIWKYIAHGVYMHPTGYDPRRSYGYVANVVHQLLRITELPTAQAAGKTFYVGDEPIPSSQWLDAFSTKLRGKPVRRVPVKVLWFAASAGEISSRLGGPCPIDRGRLYRMTTDYAVPMDQTIRVIGLGPVALEDGVDATVKWLRTSTGHTKAHV